MKTLCPLCPTERRGSRLDILQFRQTPVGKDPEFPVLLYSTEHSLNGLSNGFVFNAAGGNAYLRQAQPGSLPGNAYRVGGVEDHVHIVVSLGRTNTNAMFGTNCYRSN